jgi:hypothetical protein
MLGAAGASDRATVWVFGGNFNRHDLYYLGIWLPSRDSNKELLSNPLRDQLLYYVPPGYSFNNYPFRPSSVFSVLYGSQNKHRLYPYTALTDWFLLPRRSKFTARYGLELEI